MTEHSTKSSPTKLLNDALTWHNHGGSLVPVSSDGSKKPALETWKKYQSERADETRLQHWFSNGSDHGLGVICGAVSGNLEMFEFEGRAITEGVLTSFVEALDAHALTEVWTRLNKGYLELSPSGGIHLFYRIGDGPAKPNTKLARRLATAEELAVDPDDKRKVLIETRGEGGFTVLAPTPGTHHPSGRPWRALVGSPETIPLLTVEERDQLYAVATLFDRIPLPPQPDYHSGSTTSPTGATGLRPGDDYNQRAEWSEILTGWTRVRPIGSGWAWRRPGKKDHGISATTGQREDKDRLYVFSSSTEFEPETPYDKFGAYTLLNHNGDFKAAGKALRRAGYGDKDWDKPPRPTRSKVTPIRPGANQPSGGPGPQSDGNTAVALEQEEPDPRTVWQVDGAAEFGDRLRAELGTGPTAGLFRLSGAGLTVIRTMGEDGYIAPKVERVEHPDGTFTVLSTGTATQQPLRSSGALSGWLSECIVFQAATAQGTRRALPPIRPIQEVHARQEGLEAVRTVAGFVHTPVFRADGTLLDQPGYDPETQLLYLPEGDNITAEDIDKRSRFLRRVGKDDAMAAAVNLLKLIDGFPFKTDHDKANLMALWITPAIMPMLAEPAPIGGINAHNVGSGKTLLCSVVGDTYGGAVVYGPLPPEDEEVGKILGTTFLTTTAPVVTFDNCVGVLRSAQLARTVTKKRTEQRILGVNKSVMMDNTRLFLVNGNSLAIGGDLPRRVVPVSIDPGVPDAYLRPASSFAYPNLLKFIADHRMAIVDWILTIVRAWINAGRPKAVERTADSFADWREITAGVLKYAEVPGEVLHADASIDTVSVDDESYDSFLEYAAGRFGTAGVDQVEDLPCWTLGQLLTIPSSSVPKMWGESDEDYQARASVLTELLKTAGSREDLLAVIPDEYKNRDGTVNRVRFSLWMRHRIGRWSGVRRLRQGSLVVHKAKQWYIEEMNTPKPDEPPKGE